MHTQASIEESLLYRYQEEFYLNLWSANAKVPEKVKGFVFSLQSMLQTEAEKWKLINKVLGRLAAKGFDAAVAPLEFRKKFSGDIVILSTNSIDVKEVISCISKLSNAVFCGEVDITYADHPEVFEHAWQNVFREHMEKIGFLSTASTYVPMNEFRSKNANKPSFRISASVVDGKPSLWIDPGRRIMIPLTYGEGKAATEDDSIPVRVLMDWKKAFVVGVYEETASEYTNYQLIEHWADRGVPVEAQHRIFKVKFGGDNKSYPYPEICVYKEYERGHKEYSGRKYKPSERIQLVQELLEKRINKVKFLGKSVSFNLAPVTSSSLLFKKEKFPSPKDFVVTLKKNGQAYSINLLKVKEELEGGAEPYTGKVTGKYAVIAPLSIKGVVEQAFSIIEKTYSRLNFGKLEQALPIKYVKSDKTSDFKEAFNLTISEIKDAVHIETENVIVFVILPDVQYSGTIYYEAKDTFFNPPSFFDKVKPIQTQCIDTQTIRDIVGGKLNICETLVPQVYLKLYGRHAAVWLCTKPADSHVYASDSGITAYACFDVSRRKKYKSQVSVFTAVTDPYGRFISFDVIHSGGEGLTKASFHKLIERVAQVCKAYSNEFSKIEPSLSFNLKRIVLYRDGHVNHALKKLMADVFENGVAEEGLEPIPTFFEGRRDLPSSIAIDIVGVNKSPNRRIFMKDKNDWRNAKRGICIVENNDECLLVGSSPHKDVTGAETTTVQPLEIEKVHHFKINSQLEEPTVGALAREYFHLSYLNWLSFSQRSKYALPQKITQKTGEYISAQVRVPPNVIMW
jgi:hypothetical protein